MALTDKQILGKTAEHYALRYLLDHNLQLVKQNWHCRFGEIDLIMLDDDCLVFAEVRLRRGPQVSALESVDRRKQRKIIASARSFLHSNPGWQNHSCRFDVVAVSQNRHGFSFDWIQNAFDAG